MKTCNDQNNFRLNRCQCISWILYGVWIFFLLTDAWWKSTIRSWRKQLSFGGNQSTIYQFILGLPLLKAFLLWCFKYKSTQKVNDNMHRFCWYRFCLLNKVYTNGAFSTFGERMWRTVSSSLPFFFFMQIWNAGFKISKVLQRACFLGMLYDGLSYHTTTSSS